MEKKQENKKSSMNLSETEGVGIITIDDPDSKVNTLSMKQVPYFSEILEKVAKSETIKAIVIISGKKDNFIAGADIRELQAAPDEATILELSRKGQALFNQLENLGKPSVCAINGSCLGGGMELALSCTARIATTSSKTQVGLPEVMLGLLPGSGGTQRLPKLLGLAKALPLLLGGTSLKAERALKSGLLDFLVEEGGLRDKAISIAKRLADGSLKINRTRKGSSPEALLEKNSFGRNFILNKAKQEVMRKTRGCYPAPLAIIKVVGIGLSKGMEAGYKAESEEFARLSQTSEAKGLMSLYFAQTELKKNRFGEPSKKVEHVAVLGAGLMGAGISLVSLEKNFHVVMKDVTLDGLGRGQKYIWQALQEKVKRRSITPFARDQVVSRLSSQIDMRGFDHTDLIIEAVFEDINLKHKVLKEVEAATGKNTIFASNTSALPISDIAKASKRPENVIGMHYFSPVQKMPLLEIITTDKTSEEACAIACDVGIRQGKTVIVVKDGPGFYTSRILAPYMDEAAILCCEGVDFFMLDKMMQDFGFPVGPITLIDEVGLDVAFHVGNDLGNAFGSRIRAANPLILSDLVDAKILGRKNNRGFYLYDTNKKKGLLSGLLGGKKSSRRINSKTLDVLKKYATTTDKRVVQPKDEIQKRMAYRMINEACYCLEEGILSRPLDGDVGAVFGLGFPPFTGGPFRYIDQVGASTIVDDLNQFSDKFGERFAPSKLLVEKAKKNSLFY